MAPTARTVSSPSLLWKLAYFVGFLVVLRPVWQMLEAYKVWIHALDSLPLRFVSRAHDGLSTVKLVHFRSTNDAAPL